MNASRWWCAALLTVSAMLIAFTGNNFAQDKKAYDKHDASALYNSLRDVINTGAKMFNDQGDHAGCYRLYQGSLLSVRPFMAVDLQDKIDQGIKNAEKLGSYSDRAFELRRVLDDIRAQTKPGSIPTKKIDDKKGVDKKKDDKKVEDKKKDDKKVEDKKKDDKKVEDKKKDDKKVEDKKKDDKKFDDKKKDDKKVEDKKKDDKKFDDKKKDEDKKKDDKKFEDKKKDDKKIEDKKKDDKKADAPGEKGQVAGTLQFQGKAITGGYFVTLVAGDGKKFSSAVQKDGSFQFKTPIPTGDYRVAIEAIPGEAVKGIALPPRFTSENSSGLSVRVQADKQKLVLNLVK